MKSTHATFSIILSETLDVFQKYLDFYHTKKSSEASSAFNFSLIVLIEKVREGISFDIDWER